MKDFYSANLYPLRVSTQFSFSPCNLQCISANQEEKAEKEENNEAKEEKKEEVKEELQDVKEEEAVTTTVSILISLKQRKT